MTRFDPWTPRLRPDDSKELQLSQPTRVPGKVSPRPKGPVSYYLIGGVPTAVPAALPAPPGAEPCAERHFREWHHATRLGW